MVKQVEIKSDGDVFYEIFRYKPHHISTISPANMKGVDLHEGDWGSVGSVICWSYTHGGKENVAKDVIEAIDEEKRSVTYKVLEGDLKKQFKTFKFIVRVDTKGEKDLVTWTLEYEKLSEDVPNPETLMNICIAITKDIETHYLN